MKNIVLMAGFNTMIRDSDLLFCATLYMDICGSIICCLLIQGGPKK